MKLFDEIPYLENKRVILRRIKESDAKELDKLSFDEAVRKYLPADLFEYGFEDKKDAIRKMYEELFAEKKSLYLGIYNKENPDKLIGISEFYNYDPNWNKVSIGVRLGREHQGKALGTSAVKAQMEYLLNKTDVKRITAHVMTENQVSSAMLMKLGFRMRKFNVPEDWGFEKCVPVNKYVYEKWGNISYVKIGSGDKVMVMLPGLALKSTLGAASYIANSYSMFQNYSIYLFDDRGNIGDNYTIRERAGDVAAEMKTLGIKKACVFGASMGGMVGQYLAIDHPELVKKLFISSTASRITLPGVKKTLKYWKELARTGDYEMTAEKCLYQMHSESTIAKFGHLFKNSVGEVTEDELNKFIKLIDAIIQVNTFDELDKIKCPVFVVHSEGDRVFPVSCGLEIAEKLGCCSHIYGPEYGHAVYDEAEDHRGRIFEFFEKEENSQA